MNVILHECPYTKEIRTEKFKCDNAKYSVKKNKYYCKVAMCPVDRKIYPSVPEDFSWLSKLCAL